MSRMNTDRKKWTAGSVKFLVLVLLLLPAISSEGCSECFYEGYKARIDYDCDCRIDEMHSAFQEGYYSHNLRISTNYLEFMRSQEDLGYIVFDPEKESCTVRVYQYETGGKSQADQDKQYLETTVEYVTNLIEEKMGLIPESVKIEEYNECYTN